MLGHEGRQVMAPIRIHEVHVGLVDEQHTVKLSRQGGNRIHIDKRSRGRMGVDQTRQPGALGVHRPREVRG